MRLRIDVHAHMLPTGAVAAAGADRAWHGLRFSLDATGDIVWAAGQQHFRFNAHYWESPAERTAQLAADGLDVQLISITGSLLGHGLEPEQAAAICREINDELADYTRAERALQGLAVLPLQDTRLALIELERIIGLGLPGIVLRAQVDGENWDAARLFPILQAAAASKLLVFLHPDPWTGITDLGQFHIPDVIGQSGQLTVATAALIFGGVLDRLPELLVCVAQAGGYAPFAGGRFDRAVELWPAARVVRGLPSEYLRRVYFDCLTFSRPALACLLDVVGAERVVAGTDYPSLQALSKPAGWLAACGVAEADCTRIMSGNLSSTTWAETLSVGGSGNA